MEQVKSFCRRYRRLLLAAAYLAIFAVGVLYLRVTVNIPPEGDDKLTLNLWLYDFQRMPFWQYALQDMQGRLRYFTLQEVRFFPFHYPNAVDLLFYSSCRFPGAPWKPCPWWCRRPASCPECRS